MKRKYTQFGTASVLILLPLFAVVVTMAIRSAIAKSPDLIINVILSSVFLICLLTFFRLTITVSDSFVSFKLGIGLWGKKYKISDIKACRPVTNSMINGIGIRMLSNGWLYNVTGMKAVELQFRDKYTVVRIGTDKPEEISDLIQSLAGGGKMKGDTYQKPAGRRINPLWIIIILLVAGIAIVPNFTDRRITVQPTGIEIKGVYGVTIAYSDIEQADTVNALPVISSRTNGYSSGKTMIGNFRLSDGSRVKMFVRKGNVPYIRVKSKGEVPVFINHNDRQKTVELFKALTNR